MFVCFSSNKKKTLPTGVSVSRTASCYVGIGNEKIYSTPQPLHITLSSWNHLDDLKIKIQ